MRGFGGDSLAQLFVIVLTVMLSVLFCLLACFVMRTIEFFFYLGIFWVLLGPLSAVLVFPINLLAAVLIVHALYKRQQFVRFEQWAIQTYFARFFMLVAHLAAGMFAGRLIGLELFRMAAADVSPAAFQWACAAAVGAVNARSYLKRYNMDWRECLDPAIVIA